MSAVKLLREVQAAGGRVSVLSPDRLRLRADAPLPDALVDELRRRKVEVIRLLTGAAGATGSAGREGDKRIGADETADDFEERAAMIEFDGGIPREWAEGYARLCTVPCPPSVREREWQALIDGTGRLLDRWGHRLVTLGWKTADVFAVHRDAPLARLDQAGLVALLIHREVVDIGADTVTLQTRSGARQTYRRCPTSGPERVIVWNLERVEAERGAAEVTA